MPQNLWYLQALFRQHFFSEYPEEKDHDECVSKEDEVGQPACDGRLVHKVMDGEQEEVESRGAWRRRRRCTVEPPLY
jgi:hypothetical protein